jgi:aldehyde dehydrogenase (NAD+)
MLSEEIVVEHRMLIDGKLVEADSSKRFASIDPATGQSLGEVSDGDPIEMERAVVAARRAFDQTPWATDHTFRQRCLHQLSDVVSGAREELRRLDTADLGRPVAYTGGSIDGMTPMISKIADFAAAYAYERPLPGGAGILQREPFGVVGAILTWNCSFMLWATKVVPALAAGNAVVVRPAPETPFVSTFLGRLIAENTDIPNGIVNVVASDNPASAIALTEDPRVDMITFTGSTRVGRQIMAQASGTVKKVLLELGGKSANVLLDDGEMDLALRASVGLLCMSAGQACGALSRILLPRSCYDEAVHKAAEMLRSVVVGDPWDDSTVQGPQISAAHQQRILALIARAQIEGGHLVVGGGVPDLPHGFYVEPTLIADVHPDSTIAQEEVFGPVLAAIPYDDDDHAIQIANNSIYGLSGAVFTGDIDRGLAVAKRMRTGSVSINGAPTFGVSPFGGYKQSGIGREIGEWGFEELLESKGIGVAV